MLGRERTVPLDRIKQSKAYIKEIAAIISRIGKVAGNMPASGKYAGTVPVWGG